MKLYKDNGTKIFNPETGRYVKKSGTVGRRLERMTNDEYNALGAGAGAGAGASAEEGGVKVFSNDKTKIMNPSSNRFVAVAGALGRKLLRMSNQEYTALKTGAPAPKKPVKRSEALQQVIREQQAGTIVRGVRRGDQVRGRARNRENPPARSIGNVAQALRRDREVVQDDVPEDVAENPPARSIGNVAQALAREREVEQDDIRMADNPPAQPVRNWDRSIDGDVALAARVREVVQENPEVAIIPPGRNIRDVANALARGGMPEMLALERAVTDEIPFVDQPVLERDNTDPSSYRPPELQRQVTELDQYQEPSQEGASYLNILLNVADVLDEITEQLEEEEEAKEVGMTAQDIDDLIFNEIQDTIRLERARELTRLTRQELKEQDLIEEEMQYVYDDFYGLEPVEDDTADYRNAWEDAVKKLNELVEQEFGEEEKEEVGVEEAKEEGQVFDELTRAMGMDEEEKRERTIDDYIEDLGRNLMNLEFLDSGRAPYQSASSVPDPHLDAFDHIAQSKK